MNVDMYTPAGEKKGKLELPVSLFEDHINMGLIHQAVMLQQSNRRRPIAHAKNRSEVEGSTRKLYGQKHTGRARRGSIRSPLLRGGGKAFGPRSIQNFRKDMPKAMRHCALRSALSLQAKKNAIIGLQSYPKTIKTKDAVQLIKKLPVEYGRRMLFVLPEKHDGLTLSTRNVPGVETVVASYLNPEGVIAARSIIFLEGAMEKAEQIFGNKGMKRRKGLKGDETKRKTSNELTSNESEKPKRKTSSTNL